MMLDAYENPVSTTSTSACDAYNRGVHRFLGAEPSVEESFQLAIAHQSYFKIFMLLAFLLGKQLVGL